MPVKRVQTLKGPGYRWGSSGKIYTYTPKNKASRERAKKKAEKQGQVVRSTGWRD